MKRGLKVHGVCVRLANLGVVATIAPMKRGLKVAEIVGEENQKHQVATIAPMKRGLKDSAQLHSTSASIL